MARFITFAGRKQVGKDTSANMIEELVFASDKAINAFPSCRTVHFADALKKACNLIFGISLQDMETEDGKQKLTHVRWPVDVSDADEKRKLWLAWEAYQQEFPLDAHMHEEFMTVRQVLQFVGTDLFRSQLDPDIWVNSVFNQPWAPNDLILVADARFPNEAKIAKERGLLIKIENPRQDKGADTHVSETALDDYNDYDHVIVNDKSFDDLEEKLRVVLLQEGIL